MKCLVSPPLTLEVPLLKSLASDANLSSFLLPPSPSPLVLLVVISIATIRSPLSAKLMPTQAAKKRAAYRAETWENQVTYHSPTSGTEKCRYAAAFALLLRSLVVVDAVVMMVMVWLLDVAATAATWTSCLRVIPVLVSVW